MPCNLVRQTTVELANAQPVELLRALGALGIIRTRAYQYVDDPAEAKQLLKGMYANGKLTIAGLVEPNAVKVAYSREVVRSTAKRFNWALTEKDETHITAMRRS